MMYWIEYEGLKIRVIETELPQGFRMACFTEEMPGAVFLERSLAREAKVQILIGYFLQIMRQEPVKTQEIAPHCVVDAPVLDK